MVDVAEYSRALGVRLSDIKYMGSNLVEGLQANVSSKVLF